MVEATAFQTRARTVDHLGREQIADCPTAVSELWKNAFDAYARSVELIIFAGVDDAGPAGAIADDGHGMNRQEFLDRWLVVGTETKLAADKTSVADQNNLRVRPRQGQKGIGRLSCANLGHTLLLVSKRTTSPFVAALVDWRLFENPFSNQAAGCGLCRWCVGRHNEVTSIEIWSRRTFPHQPPRAAPSPGHS